MHICICSQQWDPEVGVPQRRMNWLVEGLVQRGHSVCVVTSPPHYPKGKLAYKDKCYQPGSRSYGRNNELIYRTQFFEYRNTVPSRLLDQGVACASSLPTINRAIADKKPDLILATAPPLPSIATAFYAHKRFGIPFVVDLRDAWPDLASYVAYTDPAVPEPTLLRKAGAVVIQGSGRVIAEMMRASDGLILSTFTHASEVNGRWGVRTHVMRNLAGLNIEESEEKKPKIFDGTLEVLYLGKIGRAQGLHSVLAALEILKERNVPVHVRIQGGGAYANYLRDKAQKLGLPLDIRGAIPREKALALQSEAHTLLVPLQDWDALRMTVPSKIYESLLSDTHVTATARGELADIVRASGAGDAVEPMNPHALADLWQELCENPERLNVVGKGRKWLVENANPLIERERTIDFLEETVCEAC